MSELVLEYAKQLTWENREKALSNQIYILGKQLHKIEIVSDKVDVVVMDTSLLLGAVYAPKGYHNSFRSLLFEIYNSMDNMNFYVERHKPYLAVGRYQNEQQAKNIDIDVKDWLDINEVTYESVPGTEEGVSIITEKILNRFC